jgi:sulfofructose kinase
MGTILGFGAAAYDIIVRIKQMPQWDETEYVDSYQVQQGGMAATGIVAAAKLGAEAEFIGAVNNDTAGQFHLHNFDSYGIRHDRVILYDGLRNALTVALVNQNTGKRSFIHYKGLNTKESIPVGAIDFNSVTHVLYDGFFFDSAFVMAQRAKKVGIVNVTDISLGNRNPRLKAFLALMDYPVVSELFACAYTGCRDPSEAGKVLFQKSNKALIVTCGSKGACIITGEKIHWIAAVDAGPVVDSTGAGDVFHGAFVFSLSRGYGLEQSVLFANACAALKCRKPGGQSGIPSFDEVRKILINQYPSCSVWLK